MNHKIIQLTRGLSALVDEDDFDRLNQFDWHVVGKIDNECYAKRHIHASKYRQKTVWMHRYILGDPPFSKADVDHINGNRLDNRKSNLRWCNRAINRQNSIKSSKTKNKYKGVYFRGNGIGYQALIRVNRKLLHIGCFKKQSDAAKAYNDAAIKYYGPLAGINKNIEDDTNGRQL